MPKAKAQETLASPKDGELAPDFTLAGMAGDVALSQLRGKRVVLFAYAKDNTPGCTVEANDFQALMPQFEAAGVTLLGLSKDSIPTHQKFAAKHGLTMDLLSDKGGQMMEDWGLFGDKIFFGKEVRGALRATLLIGPDGVVEKRWRVEKVKGHAEAVLAEVLK